MVAGKQGLEVMRHLVVWSLCMLALAVYAEVPVEDVGAGMSAVQAANSDNAASMPALVQDSDSTVDSEQLFFQLQTLQEEVQRLRGLLEEQEHELEKLKQQRLDDYLDLDRRLAALQNNNSDNKDENKATVLHSGNITADNPLQKKQYDAAYELLKQRKTEQALVAFQQLLKDYPQGQYAANAHYWSGEIYLLQGKTEQAQESFNTVISDFPDGRKKADAQFKLGKIYFQQGDKNKAKSLIGEAAKAEGPVAALASDFLKNNF